MIEFEGPNFSDNGYSKILYRTSGKTILAEGLEILADLEKRVNESWERQSPVFVHHGTYEAHKKGERKIVCFLKGGCYTSKDYEENAARSLRSLGFCIGQECE